MSQYSMCYSLASGDVIYLTNKQFAIIIIHDNNELLAFDTWQNYPLDNHPTIYKRIDFTPDEVQLIYKPQNGPEGTWYFVDGCTTAPQLKDATYTLGEVCPTKPIPAVS